MWDHTWAPSGTSSEWSRFAKGSSQICKAQVILIEREVIDGKRARLNDAVVRQGERAERAVFALAQAGRAPASFPIWIERLVVEYDRLSEAGEGRRKQHGDAKDRFIRHPPM